MELLMDILAGFGLIALIIIVVVLIDKCCPENRQGHLVHGERC